MAGRREALTQSGLLSADRNKGQRVARIANNFIREEIMSHRDQEIAKIKKDWAENPRWKGVKRGYSAEDVYRLRGSVQIEHTLAKRGAEKLWKMTQEMPFVNSLGAVTGNQAMQQVKAGVPAIYLSGWQVAADANDSLSMYPDQSLYAVTSVPTVVKRINNALARADQI
jgi:isocitrate lyase